MKKLNIENPFFEFMGRVGDMILLNIVFLICCIPLLTIGASYTAMYAVLLEWKEKKDIFIIREFFYYFKLNLRQKIKVGALFLITESILVFDILFLGKIGGNGFWSVIGVLIGSFTLLWLMITSYIFILMAIENLSIKNLVKKSFYEAIRNLPKTVCVIILNCIPIVCIILGTYFVGVVTPIYLVVGFSLTAYIVLLFLNPTGVFFENRIYD
ncbi:MAG: YesL family protein [Lachnospiraceae bacterium]